ncbi:hypothetical protein [Limoniibacter endophyticus]|uniref:Uncharacterized protein n=1 Tax=Limoniibacter endophyticus TaxID=1565040 RepID=A0A8J3DDY1_9HYPH|nr:hypothetical protein [Limoniibacter endophyticus]GHC61654.1 hypothetical protein GCM10010136_02330 [Limoniibacter endophyticus]
MALPEILDILADWPGWSTAFDIKRRQERSGSTSGRIYVKDIGDPLWVASYQTVSLRPNDLDRWRARLDALEEGGRLFYGRHLARCYPIAYPRGSWTPASFSGLGAVASLGANRKSLTVDDLPAGFRLQEGDLIQIGAHDLHRVVENATANASGVTPLFEIRPHLWPLAAVGQPVSVLRPRCLMAIVPGSISSTADLATGRGTISFDAIEAR